ncbi:MAG TPA: glycosyltransferase family 2 protein [Dehalococcoidia bacterium]|nr:glycosyltransferase family 2 protein [Dehalococcoidia bacterium]
MSQSLTEPLAPTTKSPLIVAVMPAYNEAGTIIGVLEKLEQTVDRIFVVDDGSTDGTGDLLAEWVDSRPETRLIRFAKNRGMSAAYYMAFQRLQKDIAAGRLSPDDLILTVDADGQHDPTDIGRLIDNLLTNRLDGVIARRDLSGYSLFKRFGNFVMSAWATLWAGMRYRDVESGFRVFRAGALAEAIKYYRGYRYSETVELAVVLPHLGYRVSNDVLVPVPVQRSRTRVKDGVIDLLAMPAAFWRVFCLRQAPRDIGGWLLYLLPALAIGGVAFIAVDLLIHPIFLAYDSMHNYTHIWFISEQIFDHARIPLRITSLDSGRAIAFPYALVPYLLGATVFPVVGDWGVVLLMAIATVGTVWAAGLARPVMKSPWFMLLFLMNPFFIDAIYAFQFATMWSFAFFFLFIWAFERDRRLLAAALLWLAISSHWIVGGLALILYGLNLVFLDRQRLRPLVMLSLPVGVALLPFAWMVLLTPSVHENTVITIVISIFDSLLRRESVILAPLVFALFAPLILKYYRPALLTFGVVLAAGVSLATIPFGFAEGSYPGAIMNSSNIYASFFASPQFQPGAVYRVLEPDDREDGMYRFVRHGAILGNEFFSESTFRRNWVESQYQCFLAFKSVDYVVVEKAYGRYHLNEQPLLDGLVSRGQASVIYRPSSGKFTAYDIRPFVAARSKPKSLSECHVY